MSEGRSRSQRLADYNHRKNRKVQADPTSREANDSITDDQEARLGDFIDDYLRKAGPKGATVNELNIAAEEADVPKGTSSASAWMSNHGYAHFIRTNHQRKTVSGRFADVWLHPDVFDPVSYYYLTRDVKKGQASD